MTQLACDVLQSLTEQILNLKQTPISVLVEDVLPPHILSNNEATARETLFSIDRKVKELVVKLDQNQSLMNKHDYQLCML